MVIVNMFSLLNYLSQIKAEIMPDECGVLLRRGYSIGEYGQRNRHYLPGFMQSIYTVPHNILLAELERHGWMDHLVHIGEE